MPGLFVTEANTSRSITAPAPEPIAGWVTEVDRACDDGVRGQTSMHSPARPVRTALTERARGLPYVVVWPLRHKRVVVRHFTTSAGRVRYRCGRRPVRPRRSR